MIKDAIEPPKESGHDDVHRVIRAGLGAIPVAGTGAVELFNRIVQPPISKRLDKWRAYIGEGLRELHEKMGIVLEKLEEHDSFIDTLMHASQVAMRTSSEEKKKGLRNAILNSALPKPPNEALQQIFLNFIDEFTEWHIRILKLVDNPEKWDAEHGNILPITLKNGIIDIIYSAFKELEDEERFCHLIWADLYNKRLVAYEHVDDGGVGTITYRTFTQDLGKQFLNFIEDPMDS